MKILIGDTRSSAFLTVVERLGWGRMCVTKTPRPYQFEPWGFDNGAFSVWREAGCPVGLTIEDWCILYDWDAYVKRLFAAKEVISDPYIAVVPDIPAGGMQSLQWSVECLMDLPSDWNWYLAIQDGMTPEAVTDVAHLVRGLFLGGSNKFKLQAKRWCDLAHSLGKKFHYARVGTRAKVIHAFRVGADSLDSSFPLWTTERFETFRKWIEGLGLQREMYEEVCT